MQERIGVAYVKATGEISRIDLYNGFSPEEGAQIGELTVHYIEDAFGIVFSEYMNSHVWTDNGWISVEARPSMDHYWNGSDWVVDLETLEEAVRTERNFKLFACDWTQMPDAPLTNEQKATWQVYRQELRDITNNLSVDKEIVWPTPP